MTQGNKVYAYKKAYVNAYEKLQEKVKADKEKKQAADEDTGSDDDAALFKMSNNDDDDDVTSTEPNGLDIVEEKEFSSFKDDKSSFEKQEMKTDIAATFEMKKTNSNGETEQDTNQKNMELESTCGSEENTQVLEENNNPPLSENSSPSTPSLDDNIYPTQVNDDDDDDDDDASKEMMDTQVLETEDILLRSQPTPTLIEEIDESDSKEPIEPETVPESTVRDQPEPELEATTDAPSLSACRALTVPYSFQKEVEKYLEDKKIVNDILAVEYEDRDNNPHSSQEISKKVRGWLTASRLGQW